MMVIGLAGGFDPDCRLQYDLSYDFLHDSAAVLLDDGRMVAAVEQERLNRIKNTNRCAIPAIRACLEIYGAKIEDIDYFAFYATEKAVNQVLYAYHTRMGVGQYRVCIRTLLGDLLEEEFGYRVNPEKFRFADHHKCHALSAYVHSGYENCLAVTIDGAGEGNSALVQRVCAGQFEELRSIPQSSSLGHFYREAIRFLGYDIFEEYKVMGLAPYGDAARFREFFKTFYELLPEGEYLVHLDRVAKLHTITEPRRGDAPFTQLHKDLAAAIQEMLERSVLHMLRHFRALSGESRLSLSGGVAHNSTLNGKILRSGIFDEVFVHPASNDAGCALGAALHAYEQLPSAAACALEHVFVGRDVGSDAAVHAQLLRWEALVDVELVDPCAVAAELIAQGKVIGWVQGRAEFGPRSLGNRSILADPRPIENLTRINRMIKKREGYRPFAPTVLEQHAHEYFEFPASVESLPYMSYVVPVRTDKRSLLGAVTHVDGSARVQTLNRRQNARYYGLIDAFYARTGVPLVLNTSFNNNVEPIVDTVDEAMACFLTTELDYLIVGNCLVSRRPDAGDAIEQFEVTIADTVALQIINLAVENGQRERVVEIFVRGGKVRRYPLSEAMGGFLLGVSDAFSFVELADAARVDDADRQKLLEELHELWSKRFVVIRPASTASSVQRGQGV
jgi:carbamoyltransferase